MSDWREAKLGELFEISSSKRVLQEDWTSSGVPFFRAREIVKLARDGVLDNELFISEQHYEKLSSQYGAPKAGDLMVSAVGTLGACYVVQPSDRFYFKDASVLRFSPKRKICSRFVWHAFQTQEVKDQIHSGSGSTVGTYTIQRANETKIKIPNLLEQRRIAAILDKAYALRAKRREALAQLDRLAQSIFVEMFGDPIGNPKGWASDLTLGDVADIVSGVTKGRNLTGKTTREVPYLAVSNVQDMRLSLDAVKVIEASEEEIERYSLKHGDLLLTEGGDPDKLGRGTLWHSELPECIHQNHVFRVRLKSNRLTPRYLNWLVGSQRGKRYFFKSAKQTTGIASINMTQLRSFPLLLPPLELQRKFEVALDALAAQRSSLLLSMQGFDDVFASAQCRAFKGEL